jgi:hypothetical protein
MTVQIFLAALCIGLTAQAQLNGVVVLKRNDHTIQRYFEGRSITFINQDDQQVEGIITGAVQDTIFLRFYDVRRVYSQFGLPALDTIHNISLAYSFSDIKTVIRVRDKLNYVADGSILMAAGVGVLVLGVFNGAYMHQPAKDWLSSGNIWAFLGLTGFGFWLTQQSERHYHLGKKFHLVYYGFPKPKESSPQ